MRSSLSPGIILSRRASLALAISGLCAAAARGEGVTTGWASIDAAAAKLIADHAAPGVSISVLKEGRFVYSKGFGLANLETVTLALPKSVYKIGSITKQFTASALLALAEDRKLSVDDPLARYFGDFPRAGEITLRQMLTHTSGLGNYTAAVPHESVIQESRLDYDDAALYRLMLSTKPLYPYEPGTVWAYSNTAYVLLGLIVQKVAGEPYGAFYERRLFERAGLADTAVDDAADVVPARASGYTPDPGAASQFDNASFISMTIPGGAGSMRSTSEDLCRWHEALFGGRVLAPESVKQMITPQRLKDGSLPKEAVSADHKDAPKPVEYGFGLQITTVGGRRAIGHPGGISGFSSVVQTIPDAHASLAVLVNCDHGVKVREGFNAVQAATAKAALA